jgi:uncharacterized protein YhfF
MLSGDGKPQTVIGTVGHTLRRFDEVDASFACDEGEDDRSLASWREEHTLLHAVGSATWVRSI